MTAFIQKLSINYVGLYIHLAICIVGFYWFQQQSLQLKISWGYSFFLFFTTLFVYNLHSVPVQDFKFQMNKKWLVIIFSFFGMSVSMLTLPMNVLLHIIPAAVLTMMYILPILPGRRKLRDLNWIKIFLLSSTISYVTTYIPFSDAGIDSFVKHFIFLSRTIFIIILGLMFDIKDYSKDKAFALKSFPVVFGVKRTKIISSVLLLFIIVIDFYLANQFIIDLPFFIALILTYMFLQLLILRTKDTPRSQLYSFGADGLLVLPYLILQLMF